MNYVQQPVAVPLALGRLGRRFRSRRSSALLLVLAMIVLLSALVLAFLASVKTELNTSQSYANGATAKQLADSATQFAISQIVTATGNTDGTLAWASQPGMIRTYNADGTPALYYKLYSSGSMITNGAAFTPATEVSPATWDSADNAGLYTDLNSPVTSDKTNYFPIIDPRALAATTANSVEGFNYTSAVDQVALPSAGSDSQRLPMPVLWLYVLQNGALATPISGKNGTVTFDNTDTTKVPSPSNPIVGRIAFWTDDETCKININTASEGTFWDRPWAHTATEEKYSTAIPLQNEFQRYPGHPAKTCLSPVLDPILAAPSPAWYYGIPGGTQTSNSNTLTAYYSLAPRISSGGTVGGNLDDTNTVNSTALPAITPKADRLYTSPDELLYSTNLPSNVRQLNSALIKTSSGITVPLDNAYLEKAKFFLTAHSRAPEVNLFGKPRMSLWPIQMSTGLRNAKDALLAFCSTINGKAYYFQRQNVYTAFGTACSSQDPTADWTATDSNGETRNQTLYTYLDNLTKKDIPGFGGNFAGKYPTTRQQILTEMFDMIRSGVNSYSNALPTSASATGYSYTPMVGDPGEGQVVPLAPTTGTAAGTRGFGRFATITQAAIVFYRSNTSAIVAPATTAAPPNISAALILNPFTPSPGLPAWSPNVHYVISGLDGFKISSTSKPSSTSLGFPVSPVLPDNWVTSRVGFSGAQNNTAGNTTAFLGLKACYRYNIDTGKGNSGTDSTKALGASTSGTPDKTKYPFYSDPTKAVALGSSDTTFDFSGGTIKILIYSGYSPMPTTLLQTITMTFPPVTKLPIPITDPAGIDYFYGNRWAGGPGQYQSKEPRVEFIMGGQKGSTTKDVVRSMEPDPNGPAKGDLRVYAALSNVPSTYFTTSPSYDSKTNPQTVWCSHTLREGSYAGSTSSDGQFGYDASVGGLGQTLDSINHEMSTDALAGYLIPQNLLAADFSSGLKEYRLGFNPAVPFGLNGAFQSNGAAGDWDNMTGAIEDGPYINKPDEGNSDTVSSMANAAGDFVNASQTGSIMTGGYFSRGLDRVAGYDYESSTGLTFSPNRQVSSAVMFGSLPTGIDPVNNSTGATAPKPWQTLLFCANPPAGSSHPGFGNPATGPPYTTPPDHLFLDLFTMPVVEPYAISEPLSTAGKVNMNYQILPFTYITRDTAVRAVLKSTRLMAIPTIASTQTAAATYGYKDGKACPYEMRYNINPDEKVGTLTGFENRFSSGDIFRCASEICGIYLVPQLISPLGTGLGATSYPTPSGTYAPPTGSGAYAAMPAWWSNFLLTGDNAREAPYGDIYPRLTTKSNTYTVHVRVQTLTKVPSTPANQWVEGQDQISSEYRGSSLVERYVDASDTTLPDFTDPASKSVEGYYKIRIVSTKKFEP